ncbi:hypothetical protein EQH94_15735 (plasmid) [Lactiplantibacillus plantarum]|nr:hypothetical protein EQH94_15735 [Lactiplantibacillus plantarum]
MVNTILKEADLFCPNSVRINFTIYLFIIPSLKSCLRNQLTSILSNGLCGNTIKDLDGFFCPLKCST